MSQNLYDDFKEEIKDGDDFVNLPSPNVSLEYEDLDLPKNIKKLILRLKNISSSGGGNDFKLGERLSDVIALSVCDIKELGGIGEFYVNALLELHRLYSNNDCIVGMKELPDSFDGLDLKKFEIINRGLDDGEISLIYRLVSNNIDVNVDSILRIDISEISSLPLMGENKKKSLQSLKTKLKKEVKRIALGEVDLQMYESEIIRDPEVEFLDFEFIDKIILSDIEDFISNMEERDSDIFQRRIGYIYNKETLENLGDKYKIERERVRQIEKKCRDKFIKFMRIDSGKLWNFIECKIESDILNKMPLTFSPFSSDENAYDFLGFITQNDGLTNYLCPKSIDFGILDEFFASEGDLTVSQAHDYLESYSNGIGTSKSKIIEILRDGNKLKISGDYLVPIKLPQREAVGYILTFHEKGLPWVDVAKIANAKGICNLSEARLSAQPFDSDYIFLCDRGRYKHVKFIDLNISVDYIFSSLSSFLSKNLINGLHIKFWHDAAEDEIRKIDYYEVRYVLRSYAKEYGYIFDGRSARDNISYGNEFKTVTQKDVILNKMRDLGHAMTKLEVAALIRSNSIGHASLYLSELMSAGLVVQVDLSRYTTPEIAFKNIDLNEIVLNIKSIIEESDLPVDCSIFEEIINQRIGCSYSKYFYSAVALSMVKYMNWYVVQNKVFSDKPIKFNSVASVARDNFKIENSINENCDILLKIINISEKEAKISVSNWKSTLMF